MHGMEVMCPCSRSATKCLQVSGLAEFTRHLLLGPSSLMSIHIRTATGLEVLDGIQRLPSAKIDNFSRDYARGSMRRKKEKLAFEQERLITDSHKPGQPRQTCSADLCKATGFSCKLLHASRHRLLAWLPANFSTSALVASAENIHRVSSFI